MANILLTQRCVRSCPYCFARKHMDDSAEDTISWQDIIYIADLFESGGERHLSLLGGEPTLHPDFIDILLYLLRRNFHISVFTSGIMAESKLEELARSLENENPEQYAFICNLNHPDLSKPEETGRIEEFLKIFGGQVTLSFNIYRIDFEMEYLFDTINRFDLKRHIRLGLAHPIPGEQNEYIPPEQFPEMAGRLLLYLPVFIKNNVSPGFDCGFPLCLFSDDQLGKLMRLQKGVFNTVKFVCNPAIDIGPDMSVWSCFPLSNVRKRSLFEFDSVREIADYYKEFHREVRSRQSGLFPECDGCVYIDNDLCAGGCLAHILDREMREARV